MAAATSEGPPLGRRRHARLAAYLVVAVDDHRLDLGSTEVDATAHGARVPAPSAVRSSQIVCFEPMTAIVSALTHPGACPLVQACDAAFAVEVGSTMGA